MRPLGLTASLVSLLGGVVEVEEVVVAVEEMAGRWGWAVGVVVRGELRGGESEGFWGGKGIGLYGEGAAARALLATALRLGLAARIVAAVGATLEGG